MTIGVLVMAYGTPASSEEIEAYYTKIRHGRPPSAEQLADLTRRYNAIGGVSPLAERTASQALGIATNLESLVPGVFDVRVGTKYATPLLEDTCAAFVDAGCTRVIGLVLAPHESSMSTAQYFERARTALGEDVAFTALGAWWNNEDFVALLASRVRDALAKVPDALTSATEVIFSAHSLPTRIVDAGDTYPDQLRDSAQLVASAVGLARFEIAWQSAGRTPDPWLGPDIRDVIANLAERGVQQIVSCPIGFVADHLEVLYDLDVEAAATAEQLGLTFVRTASLNDDPAFTAMLASLVVNAR